MSATCEHKIESPAGDVERCGSRAAGEFDLYLHGEVAVRESLCADCRNHLEGEFERVVKR